MGTSFLCICARDSLYNLSNWWIATNMANTGLSQLVWFFLSFCSVLASFVKALYPAVKWIFCWILRNYIRPHRIRLWKCKRSEKNNSKVFFNIVLVNIWSRSTCTMYASKALKLNLFYQQYALYFTNGWFHFQTHIQFERLIFFSLYFF